MPESSAEKTERATPKKRQDARKKGQVLKSAEVNTAVLTISMFVVLAAASGLMVERLTGFIGNQFALFGAQQHDLTDADLANLMGNVLFQIFLTIAPFLAVAVVMGLFVNVAQVGFLFTTEPLVPKFSKINPMQGFKRIFSTKSLFEMLKAVAKISAVGLVVYGEYIKSLDQFPMMVKLDLAAAGRTLFDMCARVAFKAAVVLAAIGVLDYLYQWYAFEKNLRMTKEEVKQEFKQMEGDPKIRARRREQQRKMSMLRMMAAIPKADVVITNPTHYAVAIQYDAEQSDAPLVLAKGKDQVAQRIKQAALEHGIHIVENKPVARALYAACEPGDQIPRDLFTAVAEILAYVYNEKKIKTNQKAFQPQDEY